MAVEPQQQHVDIGKARALLGPGGLHEGFGIEEIGVDQAGIEQAQPEGAALLDVFCVLARRLAVEIRNPEQLFGNGIPRHKAQQLGIFPSLKPSLQGTPPDIGGKIVGQPSMMPGHQVGQ